MLTIPCCACSTAHLFSINTGYHTGYHTFGKHWLSHVGAWEFFLFRTQQVLKVFHQSSFREICFHTKLLKPSSLSLCFLLQSPSHSSKKNGELLLILQDSVPMSLSGGGFLNMTERVTPFLFPQLPASKSAFVTVYGIICFRVGLTTSPLA